MDRKDKGAVMRGILKDNYDNPLNEYPYVKDQIVEIVELDGFEHVYAVYYENGVLDWIPKILVKVI
jgi:hypothetical protein